MSHDSGANPLRWDCARQGCFNLHKRPKIELFADCLPGRLAFSDVDAIAEVNGNFLVLEWKEHRRVPTGQRVLYQRWTAAGPTTVLLIVGDARGMTVDEVACVHGGAVGPWRETDMDGLRRDIRAWADWALLHPSVRAPQTAREEVTA
ncbi:MAG TPA: hypothetical protein PLP01_13020 [Phycisphaerae bacterium]|nr:hypothetical protein [Phycisphaerae bacterium]